MLTYFIKFFHLLCALGLFGIVFLCCLQCRTTNHSRFNGNDALHRILWYLSIFALLTGTFLVYPQSFTFHTPWIKAAYLLISLCIFIILFLNKLQLKNKKILLSIYFTLSIFLVLIAHDAVRKSTFIFMN
jgi:uncharacterized membrane protein YozB (DUF420 family)